MREELCRVVVCQREIHWAGGIAKEILTGILQRLLIALASARGEKYRITRLPTGNTLDCWNCQSVSSKSCGCFHVQNGYIAGARRLCAFDRKHAVKCPK